MEEELVMEEPHELTISVTKEETVELSANRRKVELLVELDGNAAVDIMPPGRELLLISPYWVV